MTVTSKLATTLFADEKSIHSHRARLALAEKSVASDVFYVGPEGSPDLLELNPSGMLPTLVDRDLVLMYSKIILEYLDERFPHPPLLPVYPVLRAKSRLMIKHIEQDWYSLFFAIEKGENLEENKVKMKSFLLKLEPLFAKNEFFMGDDFSMVDCCIAPLLWRLPAFGVDLPDKAVSLKRYAESIFQRNSFQASLSNWEMDLRFEDEF
jgi:RNA polymerase-associated protein